MPSLRDSLKPLVVKATGPTWKTKLPKGMVSQESYEQRRAKAMSWKPKS